MTRESDVRNDKQAVATQRRDDVRFTTYERAHSVRPHNP